MTALKRRNYITVFSWMLNGAAIKADNFMSDGKLFQSYCTETELFHLQALRWKCFTEQLWN